MISPVAFRTQGETYLPFISDIVFFKNRSKVQLGISDRNLVKKDMISDWEYSRVLAINSSKKNAARFYYVNPYFDNT